MVLEEGNLQLDELRYLWYHNYSLKGLLDTSNPNKQTFIYTTNLQRAVNCAKPIVLTFLLSAAAFLLPKWLGLLCVLVAGYIISGLVGTLFVLLLSVLVGKIHKNHHERSLLYWCWFPCWTFSLCCVAALTGSISGYYMWTSCWKQYWDVSQMKAYKYIDPTVVPGKQIQDAGAVDFTASTGIDGENAGCFMAAGHTYCVAPILENGTLVGNIGGLPRYGSYDYFAVGVDCCTCPAVDYRCGAWKNPLALGGIRSTDAAARPYFRLAVDSWASVHRKSTEHPLFFEWVESPVAHWESLRYRFLKLLAMAVAIPPFVALLVMMTLARLHEAMVANGWASPMNTPGPPEGFESSWARFLPDMLARHKEEAASLAMGYGYGAMQPPSG